MRHNIKIDDNLRKSIFFIVYYTLLVIVLLSWKEMDAAPPMYQRLLFVAASLVPSFFLQKTFLPIIACFSTISYYGYSHTYFPAELTFILPIILLVALFTKQGRGRLKRGNVIMLLLAFYTGFIDLLTSGTIAAVSQSFLTIYVFGTLLDSDEKEYRLFGYALCFTSIILSYEFYNVGEGMVREYSSLGMSRVFLRDPNYYGAIIAAGAVVAFREQLDNRKKTIYEKVLYISTVALTFLTVVLNGSRGAMLSLTLCCVLLVMLYPTNTKYKLIIVFSSLVGLFYLYKSGYFELMQYRIESDSGTGSERTIIWGRKVFSFLQEGSLFNLLFGFGNKEGLVLGINAAFHNDFVAALVEYGVVGFVLFISFFLSPILKSRRNFIETSILVLFLLVTVLTIEPITAGRYAHLFFYVYIEKFVLLNKRNIKMVC